MKQPSTELSSACLFIRNGYVYDTKANSGGCRITRIETISDGLIDTSKVGWTPAEPRLTDYKLRKGDILVSHINSLSHLGKCAIFSSDEDVYHGMNLLCLRVHDSWDARFVFHFLRTSKAKNHFHQRAKKAVAQCSLNAGDLGELEIPVPPLPEQQKLADILGTWDEALEKLDALIAAGVRRKQALMQQLLTGKRRLPGFSKPWEKTRFGDLMKSEDRYAVFDDEHLYHLVSARRRAEGVFFREALHGRDIKTKVMKQVRAGDFVISRMQVVHGGLGVVPPEYDGYYASDSYEVLVPRDPSKLSPRFIGHLCRTRRFWHHALVCSHGVHIEKMTFVMADFEHEKFMIPEVAEQIGIASVLDTADAELRLLRQQRAALDQQKRGLMQQLLTGKLRVNP